MGARSAPQGGVPRARGWATCGIVWGGVERSQAGVGQRVKLLGDRPFRIQRCPLGCVYADHECGHPLGGVVTAVLTQTLGRLRIPVTGGLGVQGTLPGAARRDGQARTARRGNEDPGVADSRCGARIRPLGGIAGGRQRLARGKVHAHHAFPEIMGAAVKGAAGAVLLPVEEGWGHCPAETPHRRPGGRAISFEKPD
eukprot:gene23754-biopygen14895